MTANILQAELSNLIQESKRKNTDLRNAAEKSLSDLKALPSTSESQLAADLIRRSYFANPFLLACASHNVKLATIGVLCLQRLVASHSLPDDRLKEVLDALRDSTTSGLDVQLKILQTLPALHQNYAAKLEGELLGSTLEICAALQSCKSPVASSTAAATLQQLLVSVFEKVKIEDEDGDQNKPTFELELNGTTVAVGPAAYDACRIFNDLCLLAESQKPQFLRIKSLSPTFVLELIESIVTNNPKVFATHPEQAEVLRDRLMPLIVGSLSERLSFSFTVRVMRILSLLLKRHIALVTSECEMALSLLTHLLDQDATIPWKRVLCMEVFRILYSEPGLVRFVYARFDEQEGRKNVLRDHMGALVKLASEKPALIGLGRQSTVPRGQTGGPNMTDEQVALETAGVGGFISTAVTSAESESVGISSQWSTVRVPCIEMLDKPDPPQLPDTYIYSLVLNCVGAFSEGLAKFILPLTVPADARGKRRQKASSGIEKEEASKTPQEQLHRTLSDKAPSSSKKLSIPLNPLDLDTHPQYSNIKTTAAIIDTCWPAVLATCSTFLYASLDGDFYHALVRSFQRLTHVAGLLRLSTPRDALLTTLGKAAVPADVMTVGTPGSAISFHDTLSTPGEKRTLSVDNSANDRRLSTDVGPSLLSTRNLLCLRALVNLGIALGPTLDQSAWSIVLETLQQADIVISVSTRVMSRQNSTSEFMSPAATESDGSVPKSNLGGEILAVQTASTKLFESTAEYPSAAFRDLLNALLKLFGNLEEPSNDTLTAERISPVPKASRKLGRVHQTTRSVSSSLSKSKVEIDEVRFALDKTEEVARSNVLRLANLSAEESGWHSLVDSLVFVIASTDMDSSLRLKAAAILDNIVARSMEADCSDDDALRSQIQQRGFEALVRQVLSIHGSNGQNRDVSTTSRSVDLDVHELALAILRSILEQCGESVVAGWDLIFQLIASAFENSGLTTRKFSARSSKLLRTSYSSLQLIASDFLAILPPSHMMDLVNSLHRFAAQKDDFNISLTSTTLFWNVSDFLQSQFEDLSLDEGLIKASDSDLEELATTSSSPTSKSVLWLLLLLRIVNLGVDDRQEIRNGAVQTILRIFDAYGPLLSPDAWHLCLNMVLFRMVESLQTTLAEQKYRNRVSGSGIDDSLAETTVVITSGFTSLFAGFLDVFSKHRAFEASWGRLVRFLDALLCFNHLKFDAAVFSGLDKILQQTKDVSNLGERAVELSWSLWINRNPARNQVDEESDEHQQENQEALIAYLEAYKQIYRLKKDTIQEQQVTEILRNFRTSVWGSVISRYASDLDRLSPVQSLVAGHVKSLASDIETAQSAVIFCLADFSDCAFKKARAEPNRPTYVAFSKLSTEQLRWCIQDLGIKQDIFSNEALHSALEHLALPIQQKYRWEGKDKEPALWQKATTAALDTLSTAMPYVASETRAPDHLNRFWRQVVLIATGITSADCSVTKSGASVQSDEQFDIAAFRRLQGLITKDLASPFIRDQIRRDYASAIFNASLIHAPHRLDLPRKDEPPLVNLFKPRMGRTSDPPPSIRSEMSYVLIDTLFTLVSKPPTSPESKDASDVLLPLARAAAPYLILRCSLPLKSYIHDQPLRGRMPQPRSQRRELLYILHSLVRLESQANALPKVGGVETLHRKHLYWLYSLFEQAVAVAGRDPGGVEVLEALKACLKEVGGTLGVEGPSEDDDSAE